jgi:argininosuccinate lyase
MKALARNWSKNIAMASDKTASDAKASDAKASAQLWAKDLPLDAIMHRFTVGRDPELDLNLYAFDCIASAAHVRMLHHVRLLATSDATLLLAALKDQHALALKGQVKILASQEDGHTALESALVEHCGESGKRVHLARSRNDQVLVALRLYLRSQTNNLAAQLTELIDVLIAFATQHQAAQMPGYTHMRAAMPSSFGMWGIAFAEGLMEELQALEAVWARIDRSPLGAAAGFGVPLPIDRPYSAQLLGFSRVQRSPIDCMNSRGRHEQALLDAGCSIVGVLEKLLWDLALYSTPEFGFIELPDAFTTGSSIMPQKRNPDAIELARAKCRQMRGYSALHRETISGLPSSYHRDLQLAKAPLMDGLSLLQDLLALMTHMIPQLRVRTEHAANACKDELYATEAAYQLVQAGSPFRDAYRTIASQVMADTFDASALRAQSQSNLSAQNSLQQDLVALKSELNAASIHHHARANAQHQLESNIWSLL